MENLAVVFGVAFSTITSGDGDFEEAVDVAVEFDGDFENAGGFDGFFEFDLVTVELDACGAVGNSLGNVAGGDGTECLAALAGGEGELEFEALEFGGEFFGFGEFLCFTFGADFLQFVKLLEVALVGQEGFALGDEEIVSVTASDFHDVAFGAEGGDFLFQNDVYGGHMIAF